jgi:hypothetical protein
MPIIQPAKQFENSSLDNSSEFSYIKPEVRKLIFSKNKNTEGLYVLFMPAYKADPSGAGVWYNQIDVRVEFGPERKKRYFVRNTSADPATYFERNFKGNYPQLAEVKKVTDGGKTRNAYPNYGRIQKRVVFNVGILSEFQNSQPVEKVLHVLDLPAFKGADQLTKWMNTPQPDGSMPPIINDPEASVPVYIKLNSDGIDPWQIAPNTLNRYRVPAQYADSDILYNLDDIFVEKTPEEIIAELRSSFNSDIFEKCMSGFPGFLSTVGGFQGTPASLTPPLPPPPTNVSQLPPPPPQVAIAQVTELPPPPTAPVVQNTPPPPNVASLGQPSSDVITVGGKPMSQADLRKFLEKKA